MLIQFKERLDAAPSKPIQEYQNNFGSSDYGFANVVSTTPDGSPPRVEAATGNQRSTAPPPNTNAILAALAKMAEQNQNAPPANPPNMNAQTSSYNTAVSQPSSYGPVVAQPAQSVQQNGTGIIPHRPMPGVNVPAAPNGNFAPQFQGHNNAIQNVPSNQANPFAGQPMPALNIPPLAGGLDPAMQAQMAIVQMLHAQGVPQDKWAEILLSATAAMGMPGVGFPQPPPPIGQNLNQNPAQNGNGWPVNQENSRDRIGRYDCMQVGSLPESRRGRSRSRSPQRNGGWNRNGDNHNNSYGAGRGDDRNGRGGRGGNNSQYRQRSPPARRARTPSPPRLPGSIPKWTDYDSSLPKENIKGKQMNKRVHD